MAESDSLPTGPPRHAVFGGIVEGRVGDEARLHAAAGALRELGMIGGDLTVEGPHFTWMPDDARIDGRSFGQDVQRDLLEGLGALIAAAADPARVESTLRCTVTYEHQVAETWFRIERGVLRPLSRVRPAGDADRVPELPASRGAFAGLGRARILLIATLLAFVTVVAAWQVGLVAQVFGPSAAELGARVGVLRGAVALQVEGAFLEYRVTVRADADYPKTAEALANRLAVTSTPAERAYLELLGTGGTLYLQLRDVDGHALAAVPCHLRALLEGGTVTVRLPRRLAAHEVVLALDRGD